MLQQFRGFVAQRGHTLTLSSQLAEGAVLLDDQLDRVLLLDQLFDGGDAGLIDELDATPSFSQACRLKELSQAGRLTARDMSDVMERPKANQRETVKLDADELRAYFPDQTPRQMRVSIMKILEEKKAARKMTPEPDRAPVKKGGEAR